MNEVQSETASGARASSLVGLEGRPIIDINGDGVGELKEATSGYFKVNAPMAPDFWLSAAYVVSTEPVIQLGFSNAEMDDHRLTAPGLEPDSDPEHETDRVLSPEDALGQRERMERELEAQRMRMRGQ